MNDPNVPQGGIHVDGFYVEKSTETYGVNHQTIYVLDGKFYLNGYEFSVKQDAETYANSMNVALPPDPLLTLEQRFDAFLIWLRDVHGFHVPENLAPLPDPLPFVSTPPDAPKE